jgi:hypothetical protein
MPAGMKLTSKTTPWHISYPEVKGGILAVLVNYGNKIQQDFEATTATWKDHHPRFKITRKFAGGNIVLSVTTKDEVWGHLNRGTSRRWALMSHDFLPKTAPRQLTSYPGRGKVLYRGPAEMQAAGINFAMPGIEPRDWTVTSLDLYRGEIRTELGAAIRKGLRKGALRGRT